MADWGHPAFNNSFTRSWWGTVSNALDRSTVRRLYHLCQSGLSTDPIRPVQVTTRSGSEAKLPRWDYFVCLTVAYSLTWHAHMRSTVWQLYVLIMPISVCISLSLSDQSLSNLYIFIYLYLVSDFFCNLDPICFLCLSRLQTHLPASRYWESFWKLIKLRKSFGSQIALQEIGSRGLSVCLSVRRP